MPKYDGEERNFRIGSLSYFQSGILFLFIAGGIIVYVLYQISIGQVFTKSGHLPLNSTFAWPMLVIEWIGATVGIVRGIKMVQK